MGTILNGIVIENDKFSLSAIGTTLNGIVIENDKFSLSAIGTTGEMQTLNKIFNKTIIRPS